MGHYRMPILQDTGYAVLSPYQAVIDSSEWLSLEYVDWKSSGDTRFAPLASAQGQVECNGFWHASPPRADKDGVWIPSQVGKAPTLVQRARESGANVGRCRVIELQPNSYADAIYNSHLDDNNRLNPDGEGWVVRCFMQLSDDPNSVMVLREDVNDPQTETRIALPAGAQLVVDSERLWHSVWHVGDQPRACLITSLESGPELEKWIWERDPLCSVASAQLDEGFRAAELERAEQRRAARTAFYGYDPTGIRSQA